MFNHEIVIDEHDLKLRIQSEIMFMIEDLKKSEDIGYTSWTVAENIIKRINVDKSHHKKKCWFDVEL